MLRPDDYKAISLSRLRAVRFKLIILAEDMERINWPRAAASIRESVAQCDVEIHKREQEMETA